MKAGRLFIVLLFLCLGAAAVLAGPLGSTDEAGEGTSLLFAGAPLGVQLTPVAILQSPF